MEAPSSVEGLVRPDWVRCLDTVGCPYCGEALDVSFDPMSPYACLWACPGCGACGSAGPPAKDVVVESLEL